MQCAHGFIRPDEPLQRRVDLLQRRRVVLEKRRILLHAIDKDETARVLQFSLDGDGVELMPKFVVGEIPNLCVFTDALRDKRLVEGLVAVAKKRN